MGRKRELFSEREFRSAVHGLQITEGSLFRWNRSISNWKEIHNRMNAGIIIDVMNPRFYKSDVRCAPVVVCQILGNIGIEEPTQHHGQLTIMEDMIVIQLNSTLGAYVNGA